MDSTPATSLNCTQCGGELHPETGQTFLTCPYCSATVYLDKARVVFHWSVAPTLDESGAAAALFRWMSGNETVKDLDKKSTVAGSEFRYFPLWYFRWDQDGREETLLQPAAATSITEMARLPLPAGDLKPYDSSLDARAEPPSVPLTAAMEWVLAKNPRAQTREASLVHVPIYLFKYAYRGQTYTAVVDAASGTVLANLYPAKAEAPYVIIGLVTAAVYLCLALAPIIGGLSDSDGGGAVGMLICAGGGLIAAPLLLAWAAWVAAKV